MRFEDFADAHHIATRGSEEAVAKKRQEQRARAGAEALCMKQTVEQVQGRAKANKGPKTGECCLEVAAKAEAKQATEEKAHN